MYTSVLERRKEIGVMKSVGATSREVVAIFLIEAALLGFIGGLVGALIGLGLAFLVSLAMNVAFPGIPFKVAFSFPLIFLSLVFSLVIGSIAGILPAIQASKLRPVEALRS